MKLSVWSHYFSGLSSEDKVKAFAECGYHYSELSTEDGEELLTRGEPEKVGREFGQFAADHGISFLQGHLDLQANILNRAHVEALKVWLDLFHAVGVKNCVLHYGRGKDLNIPPERLLAARARAISELTEHISGTDMYICLENISAKYDSNCDTLLDIIDAVGSEHLGICLDTGHLNLAGGNPAQFIVQAGPLLKALHIADNEGTYDQHMMPFGKGNVPWDQFMRALKQSGYDQLFNFEIPGESSAPLEIRKAKLRYIKEMSEIMYEIY